MINSSLFAERLKETRKNMELSQAAIAEICGISRETWSRYESGKLLPGMDVLAALAIKGADVQYILTGMRTPQPSTSAQSLSPREATLLDNYRNVEDEADKKVIERTAFLAALADNEELKKKSA